MIRTVTVSAFTGEEMRGLYRRSQTGRGQPSVHVDGNVKLTKLLQKLAPCQSRSEETYRSFSALLLVREACVQWWGFTYKSMHIGSFQC